MEKVAVRAIYKDPQLPGHAFVRPALWCGRKIQALSKPVPSGNIMHKAASKARHLFLAFVATAVYLPLLAVSLLGLAIKAAALRKKPLLPVANKPRKKAHVPPPPPPPNFRDFAAAYDAANRDGNLREQLPVLMERMRQFAGQFARLSRRDQDRFNEIYAALAIADSAEVHAQELQIIDRTGEEIQPHPGVRAAIVSDNIAGIPAFVVAHYVPQEGLSRGFCLFDSVARHRGGTTLTVRQAVVDYMRAHKDDFVAFCQSEEIDEARRKASYRQQLGEEDMDVDLETLQDRMKAHIADQRAVPVGEIDDFELYLNYMEQAQSFGGHPELVAIATLFQCNVAVLTGPDEGPYQIAPGGLLGPAGDVAHDPILLHYNRGSEHYRAFVPRG